MSRYRIDVEKLLNSGEPDKVFIDLTTAVVSSPYIEGDIKLGILKELVNHYETLNND